MNQLSDGTFTDNQVHPSFSDTPAMMAVIEFFVSLVLMIAALHFIVPTHD
jgi:hypothetical protein